MILPRRAALSGVGPIRPREVSSGISVAPPFSSARCSPSTPMRLAATNRSRRPHGSRSRSIQPLSMPLSDRSNCKNAPGEEDIESNIVTCSDWTMHAEYRSDEDRRDPGIPYDEGCGDSESDDNCSSDTVVYDAASQVRIGDTASRSAPFRISPDGHHVAYFSKQRAAFVGWGSSRGEDTGDLPETGYPEAGRSLRGRHLPRRPSVLRRVRR